MGKVGSCGIHESAVEAFCYAVLLGSMWGCGDVCYAPSRRMYVEVYSLALSVRKKEGYRPVVVLMVSKMLSMCVVTSARFLRKNMTENRERVSTNVAAYTWPWGEGG